MTFSAAATAAPTATETAHVDTPRQAVTPGRAAACAALEQDLAHAPEALARYLDALAKSFDGFAVQEPANGLLDCKVLAAIDRFVPYLGEYRCVLSAIGAREDAQHFATPLIGFFSAIAPFKNVCARRSGQSVLWADGYRFILRELFLTSVAILLRHGRYALVAALLGARYRADEQDDSFVTFDGYAKTLDEFRNRRLQMHRLSVSSDLLRERADAAHCDFEEIMQADFLLCLRSLLCEDNFFVRWHPRTLVFAERFAARGFDLFVTTAAPERFGPLATLLEVDDRDALIRRFEDVRDAWCLDGWELGGCPLDFRGYMGLSNPALAG